MSRLARRLRSGEAFPATSLESAIGDAPVVVDGEKSLSKTVGLFVNWGERWSMVTLRLGGRGCTQLRDEAYDGGHGRAH